MMPNVRPEAEPEILRKTESRIRSVRLLRAAGSLVANLRLLVAMLRDGSFHLSWQTKALILSAMAHFLMPLDSVPDVIPIVGFIDDTVVVGAVIRRLNGEIERYKDHISWNS